MSEFQYTSTSVDEANTICSQHHVPMIPPDPGSVDLVCPEDGCGQWVPNPEVPVHPEWLCECGEPTAALATEVAEGWIEMWGWFCPECDADTIAECENLSRNMGYEADGFIDEEMNSFGIANRYVARFGYRTRYTPGTSPGNGTWMRWDGSSWEAVGGEVIEAKMRYIIEGLSFARCREWQDDRKETRELRKSLPPGTVLLRPPMNPGWLELSNDNPHREAEIAAAKQMLASAETKRDREKALRVASAFELWGEEQQESRAIASAMSALKADPRILSTEADFAATPGLLALGNGVLKVDTHRKRFRFLPALPEQMTSKKVPFDRDEGAACPKWERFLEMNFPDPETRRYLQKLVGYSLIGKPTEKAFWFFYSRVPDTGKSLFLEVWCSLLGEGEGGYATTLSQSTLSPRKNGGDGGRDPDRHALMGKRLAASTELKKNEPLDEAFIKRLTSGGMDSVSSRGNYSTGNTVWRPECVLTIATNNLSRIDGGDEAVWSRVVVVPFTRAFPKGDPDRNENLASEITSEELPGVFEWALRGLRGYLEEGLKPSAEIAEATAAYQAESDGIGRLLTALLEEGRIVMEPAESEEAARDAVNSGNCVSPTELFKFVKEYARDRSEVFDMTATAFREKLEKEGHPYVQGTRGAMNGKRRLAGIRIASSVGAYNPDDPFGG